MTTPRTVAGRVARTTALAGLALAMAVGCSKDKDKGSKEKAATPPAQSTPGAASPGAATRERPALPTAPHSKERFRRFAERRAEMMKKYDKDGDGKLDLEERKALHAERVKTLMGAVDADKDGKITRKEAEASDDRRARGLLRRFERLDADKDGSLTEAELQERMMRRPHRDKRR